jgi:hypothetical protein
MDTSKNTDIDILKYKGFDSIYDSMNQRNWKLKNLGYKYEDTLFEDNTSRYLQRNTMMLDMFKYLNKIMSHLINSVKYLRNYNNWAVPKDYKHIN